MPNTFDYDHSFPNSPSFVGRFYSMLFIQRARAFPKKQKKEEKVKDRCLGYEGGQFLRDKLFSFPHYPID